MPREEEDRMKVFQLADEYLNLEEELLDESRMGDTWIELSNCYLHGEGTPKNEELALYWASKAMKHYDEIDDNITTFCEHILPVACKHNDRYLIASLLKLLKRSSDFDWQKALKQTLWKARRNCHEIMAESGMIEINSPVSGEGVKLSNQYRRKCSEISFLKVVTNKKHDCC